MPGGRRFHAGVRKFRGIAWLWRSVAVVLSCGAVIGLLAAMGVTPAAGQTIDCSSQASTALIRDCETLLGLKGTLDPDDVLNWAGNVAMGTWDGVATDNAFGVTGLSLNNNGLGGSIPAALGDLSNLTYVYISRNELSGNIPAQLGNLSNLTSLDFSDNQLSGSIPAQLGNLSNLTNLNLSVNQLSGSIPTALGDLSSLSNLTQLSLIKNQLSGSIPVELGNLSNLTYLGLGWNELSGSIPTQLGNLSNLTVLFLGRNELSGSIPAQLGSLRACTTLMKMDRGGAGAGHTWPTQSKSGWMWGTLHSLCSSVGSVPTRQRSAPRPSAAAAP